MPLIPNRHEFEPDRDALQLWLATRKNKEKSALVTRPGLFYTRDFSTDQTAFFVVIVLELIGLALLIYGGFTKAGGRFVLVASTLAIAFFLVDIVLALALHRNEAAKCEARNGNLLETDGPQRIRNQDTLNRGKILNGLIIFAMIVIALMKLAGIIFLGSGLDHPGIILALTIMFFLIVFIHVRHTGYYLYEKRTERAFKKQFRAYNYGTVDAQGNRVGQAKSRNLLFNYVGDNLLGNDEQGEKRLELNGNNSSKIRRLRQTEAGDWEYQLTTLGILTDEDVSAFLNKSGLNNDQVSRLASACLEHQISRNLAG